MKTFSLFTFAFSLLIAVSPGKNTIEPFLKKSTFTAEVVGVSEGDLISVKLDEGFISVRLVEVDSPEIRQTFGRQARNFTRDLIAGKKVTIIVKMVDRYKRIIGEVVLPDGRSLNQEVVRWGYAWHYKADPKPSKTLSKLEYNAWQKNLGLWIDSDPVPPWKFRGGGSSHEPPVSSAQVDYDEIFNYGLIGDPKTLRYQWPACKNYKSLPPEERIVFTNKVQAEGMGYQADNNCSSNNP